MELLDTVAITWMSRYRRNPFPKKIVWKQDDVTHNRFYWLRDENPTERSLIAASIEGQTIEIENTSVSEFTIMLNDSLIDMDKSVIVQYDGKEIFNATVPRTSSTILKSIREYGDLSPFIMVRYLSHWRTSLSKSVKIMNGKKFIAILFSFFFDFCFSSIL